MKGWHKDNYRHSLAARGLSKYYAHKYRADSEAKIQGADININESVKTQEAKEGIQSLWDKATGTSLAPQSALGRAQAAAREVKYMEEVARSSRPINRIISDVNAGAYNGALRILAPKYDVKTHETYIEDVDGSITGTKGGRILVTDADQAAAKNALSERALTLANLRMPIPEEITKQLDKEFIDHLKTIKDAKRREDETPFRKVLRENLQKATIGTAAGMAEAPGEGLAWAKEGYDSLGNKQDFPGVATRFNQLADNPLKKNSVFAGHEEDGLANPLHWMDEGVPRLDSSYSYLGNVSNPAMSSGVAQRALAAKRISEQVESLYNDKDELAETDIKKYEEGMKAFKKGDREQVIRAISELEAEENKLKDRWLLIGATHRGMLSADNQQAAFHKSSDNPVLDMSSSGARKIADQTEKLARVRGNMLDSMNKTYTRRVLLQNALTRLNSTIPPDKDAPRNVKRLDAPRNSLKIGDIPNPVLHVPNYVTEAPQ
jgi:hypothetical protein